MREILFRAKRVDNGEWVQGLLPYANEIRVFTTHKWNDEGEEREYATTEDLRVIPETVGQFTGLTDKNGKKIFEGDALKARHNDYPYLVSYEMCGLKIEDKWGNGIKMTQEAINWLEVEIVGNIHDNPEFLEANNG